MLRTATVTQRRTPRGVRGLKYVLDSTKIKNRKSHPSRGAWIEIPLEPCVTLLSQVAPLAGCVD